MAIKGYAHVDQATSRLLAGELPADATFDSITLSNGLGVAYGILDITTGIDATVATNVALMTVPASHIAIVTHALFLLGNVDSIVGALVAGIGTNGAQDNIMTSTTLTGLNTNGQMLIQPLTGLTAIAAAGETISIGIDSAFTGTSASLMVVLLGMLAPE
jgi:hypothetical protein